MQVEIEISELKKEKEVWERRLNNIKQTVVYLEQQARQLSVQTRQSFRYNTGGKHIFSPNKSHAPLQSIHDTSIYRWGEWFNPGEHTLGLKHVKSNTFLYFSLPLYQIDNKYSVLIVRKLLLYALLLLKLYRPVYFKNAKACT